MSASKLILASKSPSRANLLRSAGLEFDVVVTGVDEDSVKESLIAEGATAQEIAVTLSDLKAIRAQAGPSDYVIAADQVLTSDGELFSKPVDLSQGRAQLKQLRGKTHKLISAVSIAKTGSVIWRYNETSLMTMRDFSDDFLETYLEMNQDAVLSSVGSYWLESQGIQLFRRIEGDYFAILGLPLLPVLDFLRLHEVVTT